MPNAASPMKLTQNLSGAATLAPMARPETGAELVRLAPAQITARRGGAVERQQLIARAAGVVGHDRSRGIDHAHELRHHVIRRDRALLGVQLRFPRVQPGGAFGGDFGGGRRLGSLPPSRSFTASISGSE